MENQYIKIEKTARYITIGNKDLANILIIALHGYGQLATFFSRNFNELDKNYYIIIPEGLHRFYNSGTSGRVGASWMTKEDRLIDIEDNMNFLNKLYESEECHLFKTKILIGFSQGASTGLRWLMHKPSLFQSYISWGSSISDDIEFESIKDVIPDKNFFVIGRKDPYFSDLQKQMVIDQYFDLGFEIIHFEGEHKIDKALLNTILKTFK